MTRLRPLALAVLIAATGCFHATIETGKPASQTVVSKPFQPSFIAGLVPPPTVNTAQACPSGVSKVETVHSFVEGLVAAITFNIFTPMTIKITCAAMAPVGREELYVGL